MTNNVNANQLDELHTYAKSLIDTCSPDIVQKINESVKAAENEWKETNNNLRNLKDKYGRAIDLWSKYRDSSDAIKNWAADRMGTINVLKPLDENTIEVITKFFVHYACSKLYANLQVTHTFIIYLGCYLYHKCILLLCFTIITR